MVAQTDRNAWRLKGAGLTSFGDRLVTGSKDKYFIVSSDSHANEPLDFMTSRVTDPQYQDRLPRVKVDEEGVQWLHTDGWPPQRVSVPSNRRDLLPEQESFESFEVLAPYTDRMEDQDVLRTASGRSVEQRLQHAAEEGSMQKSYSRRKAFWASPRPTRCSRES